MAVVGCCRATIEQIREHAWFCVDYTPAAGSVYAPGDPGYSAIFNESVQPQSVKVRLP
jgi:hypothetical protein